MFCLVLQGFWTSVNFCFFNAIKIYLFNVYKGCIYLLHIFASMYLCGRNSNKYIFLIQNLKQFKNLYKMKNVFNFWQVYYLDNDRNKKIISFDMSYQAAVKLCQQMATQYNLSCFYESVII